MPDARLERTRHAYHDAAQPDCDCTLCQRVLALATLDRTDPLAVIARRYDAAFRRATTF